MAATSTRTEDGKVRNLNVKNKTLFSKFTPIFLLLSQPRIQDRRDDRVPVAQSNFKKFSTFALSLPRIKQHSFLCNDGSRVYILLGLDTVLKEYL